MQSKNGIIVLSIVTVLGVGAICACILVIGAVYFLWPQPVQSAAPAATQTPLPAPPTPTNTATPSPEPQAAVCSGRLFRDLQISEADAGNGNEGEDRTLVSYSVAGNDLSSPQFSDVPQNLKTFQQDLAGQEKVWDLFTQLIPLDWRTEVTNFTLFTDGRNGTLGAVVQMDDPHDWSLEMDLADAVSSADLSTTLVHEFGHILTLNDAQVVTDRLVFDNPDDRLIFDRESVKCPDYFTFEGCSQPKSYLNLFVQRFWPALFPDWNSFQGETDPDLLDQDTYDFYKKYADQFVSEYAATSPEEDLAETWLFFIFAPRPEGSSIADRKILFFYEFPELVTLRSQILTPLCAYVEQP
jgi:hypothetical protein